MTRGRNLVVIGAQWGDEGKGKIVDWLTDRCAAVARLPTFTGAGASMSPSPVNMSKASSSGFTSVKPSGVTSYFTALSRALCSSWAFDGSSTMGCCGAA